MIRKPPRSLAFCALSSSPVTSVTSTNLSTPTPNTMPRMITDQEGARKYPAATETRKAPKPTRWMNCRKIACDTRPPKRISFIIGHLFRQGAETEGRKLHIRKVLRESLEHRHAHGDPHFDLFADQRTRTVGDG